MTKLTDEFEQLIDICIAKSGSCTVLCEESIAVEYMGRNKNMSAIGRMTDFYFVGNDVLSKIPVNIIQGDIIVKSNMMTYRFFRR